MNIVHGPCLPVLLNPGLLGFEWNLVHLWWLNCVTIDVLTIKIIPTMGQSSLSYLSFNVTAGGKTRRSICSVLRLRSITCWVVWLFSTRKDLFNPNFCLLATTQLSPTVWQIRQGELWLCSILRNQCCSCKYGYLVPLPISSVPIINTLQMCSSEKNFSPRMLQPPKFYKVEYYLRGKLPNYLMMS